MPAGTELGQLPAARGQQLDAGDTPGFGCQPLSHNLDPGACAFHVRKELGCRFFGLAKR